MSEEKTISTRNIYSGRIINVRDDEVLLPNGRITRREIVEHSDVVAVVAIDDEDNVLLVKQYRKPVEKSLLEIPAGGVEDGESPHECALREMQEETGYLPGALKQIGGVYSSPGYCSEYLYLYLATDLNPSKLSADDDEEIELVKTPVDRVRSLISSGKICDAKSVSALLIALHERGL